MAIHSPPTDIQPVSPDDRSSGLAFGEAVRGEAPSGLARGTEDPMARPAVEGSAAPPRCGGELMEVVVARDNLKEALRQVKRNKGAPGFDGMTVAELTPYLKEHWPAIRADCKYASPHMMAVTQAA